MFLWLKVSLGKIRNNFLVDFTLTSHGERITKIHERVMLLERFCGASHCGELNVFASAKLSCGIVCVQGYLVIHACFKKYFYINKASPELVCFYSIL